MFGAVVGIGDYPDCGHNDKYTLAFSLRLFFSHHKNPQNSRIEKFLVGDNLEKMTVEYEQVRRVDKDSRVWLQRRPGLELIKEDIAIVIGLAVAEVAELLLAIEAFGILSVQALEEIPDPILYLLQVLRFYKVNTEDLLYRCLTSNPPSNQITPADLELASKKLKSKRIERTRVELIEQLITLISLFCSQHGIDLLKLLIIKNFYNEVRFDVEHREEPKQADGALNFQTRSLADEDRKRAKIDEEKGKLKKDVLYQLLEYYLEDKESHIDGETKEVPRPRLVVPSREISIPSSP